jgi:hypothetical protein
MFEELGELGFVVITVAFERNAEDAREWIEAAAPTHPSLIDTTWSIADLYHVENVPTVFWIDEEGRIVRPQDVAFGSNMFQDFTGVDAFVHQTALRSWVRGETPPLDPSAVESYLRVPSEADQLARAEFGLGRWLWEQGRGDAARPHFQRAEELAPNLWTCWRGSMRMQDEDPMGQLFFDKMTAYREEGGVTARIIPA